MALLLSLVLAAPVPKKPAAETWVGRMVFPKTPAVTLWQVQPDGSSKPGPKNYLAYRAIREDGDRLYVYAGGRVSWFRRGTVMRTEEAIDHYTAEIRDNDKPGVDGGFLAGLYHRRGWACREGERLDDALRDYDKAIGLDASQTHLRHSRASILIALGRTDDALADIEHVLKRQPEQPHSWYYRGWVRLTRKQYADAEADLNKAVDLARGSAVWYRLMRASIREAVGRFADAVADLEAAEAEDAESADVWNHRAWVMAIAPDPKLRDGKRAVELALKAVDATGGRNGTFLDTLAAAYAEVGRFDDAVTAQERALTDPAFARADKAEAVTRMSLYRQKKPYRPEGRK